MPTHSAIATTPRALKQVSFPSDSPTTIKNFNVRDPVVALNLPRTAVFNLPERTTDQIYEELEKKKVLVTSLHYNFTHIRGSVYVKNLSFEKEVAVRYTFNNWAIANERKAQYKGPVLQLNRGVVDEFFFEIDLQACSKPNTLCFAIRYRVQGAEFWDNNDEKNYLLNYTFTGFSRNAHRFQMPAKPIFKIPSPRTLSTDSLLNPSTTPISSAPPQPLIFQQPQNNSEQQLYNLSIQALARCPSFDSYVSQTSFDYNLHMPPLVSFSN
jgi:hypothetical protein